MAKKYKNTVHKHPFKSDMPGKKISVTAIAVVALSVLCVVLLSVFVNNFYGVIRLTTTSAGNNVYDRRNRITYDYAPMCYEPVTLTGKNDPYAVFGDTNFYKIKGIDPKYMISTSEDGIHEIYCASDFSLPSLTEFEAIGAQLCEVDIAAITVGALTKEQAQTAITALTEGEQSEYPVDIIPDSVLYVYFVSEKYSYIYYYVTFFVTESGDRYLYDRSFGNCVCLPDDVLSDVLVWTES